MTDKVRHVDFYFDEWIAGTVGLTNDERGLYITACAMIYSHGGPVTRDDLKEACKDHGHAFNRQLSRLVTLGKLDENDGQISNKRCANELQKAVARPPLEEWRAIRRIVFDRDNYTCKYCGTRGGALECDHVIPASRGGPAELHNLVTSCRPCNRRKRNRTPDEWRAAR